MQQLGDNFAVKITEIQNADLAFQRAHIGYHLIGFGFPNSKFILQNVKLFHHLHKSLNRKGIMLSGNAKFLFEIASLKAAEFLLQKLILLINLPGRG